MTEIRDPLKAALGIFQANFIRKPQWDPGFLQSRVHVFRGETAVVSAVVAFDRGLIRNLVGRYSSHVNILDSGECLSGE